MEFTSLSLPGISNQNSESLSESLNNNIDPSTTSPELYFQSTTGRLNERQLQRRFWIFFKRPNNSPTQKEQQRGGAKHLDITDTLSSFLMQSFGSRMQSLFKFEILVFDTPAFAANHPFDKLGEIYLIRDILLRDVLLANETYLTPRTRNPQSDPGDECRN